MIQKIETTCYACGKRRHKCNLLFESKTIRPYCKNIFDCSQGAVIPLLSYEMILSYASYKIYKSDIDSLTRL